MPGLRLTRAQAADCGRSDDTLCEAVLSALADARASGRIAQRVSHPRLVGRGGLVRRSG